jgi:hypothetical protein
MRRDMIICAHSYCVKRSPDGLISYLPIFHHAGLYLLDPHMKYTVYSPLATVSTKADNQRIVHVRVIDTYSG